MALFGCDYLETRGNFFVEYVCGRTKKQIDTRVAQLGYIDYTGALVIDAIYDNCGAFAEDMSFARVQYNGLWGMIDKEGNWLIEAKFLKIVG